MTENLRLEFDGETTYDSTTTNLAEGTTITPSAAQARTAAATAEEITEWNSVDYRQEPEYVNRWLSRSTQKTRESDMTSGNLTGENQLLGTYYNYYTATAGSNPYPFATAGPSNSDICPKGWSLPSFGNNTTYANLILNTYNIVAEWGYQDEETFNRIHNEPISFPFSGLVGSSGATSGQANFTRMWTSWVGASWTGARTLEVYDRILDGQRQMFISAGNTFVYLVDGISVRCVAL